MTTVNSRVFSAKPIYYLNLASKESVAIKRGKKIIRLVPEPAKYKNTIDPEDPYWDDERNYLELVRRDKLCKEGKEKIVATLSSCEDIDNYMNRFLSPCTN